MAQHTSYNGSDAMQVVIMERDNFYTYKQTGLMPRTGAWIEFMKVPRGTWEGLNSYSISLFLPINIAIS